MKLVPAMFAGALGKPTRKQLKETVERGVRREYPNWTNSQISSEASRRIRGENKP